MRWLRWLALVAAAVAAVLAVTAYRRSARSGAPFGVCLRDVAGEWSLPALRARARRSVGDGLSAAALREGAADHDSAAAETAVA